MVTKHTNQIIMNLIYKYNIMKICIVSVFKNESHALQEWLEHYIREGVDTFLLTDNGSTDEYQPIIEPYIQSGRVILNINPTKHSQNENLNYYLKDAKKFDWVIIVDLDEFVYSRRGFATIKEYLKTLPSDVHKINIPWKLFGSSGLKEQPTSIIQNFIHRRKFPEKTCHTCYDIFVEKKTIIRGKHIKKLDIHNSITEKSHTITPDNNDIDGIDIYEKCTEKKLRKSYLHLNHYRIQSWEWFKTNKMNRTDAYAKKFNNIRNKKYFDFFDYSDTIDSELKNKKYHKKSKKNKKLKNKTVKIKFF
jgi:hypothetical protein